MAFQEGTLRTITVPDIEVKLNQLEKAGRFGLYLECFSSAARYLGCSYSLDYAYGGVAMSWAGSPPDDARWHGLAKQGLREHAKPVSDELEDVISNRLKFNSLGDLICETYVSSCIYPERKTPITIARVLGGTSILGKDETRRKSRIEASKLQKDMQECADCVLMGLIRLRWALEGRKREVKDLEDEFARVHQEGARAVQLAHSAPLF